VDPSDAWPDGRIWEEDQAPLAEVGPRQSPDPYVCGAV